MGIQTWLPRQAAQPVSGASQLLTPEQSIDSLAGNLSEPVQSPPSVAEQDLGRVDWAALHYYVQNCDRCALHQSRTQTVFGVGDTQAQWMIIGEAPGADEDRQGEPFVGRAGQLLNEMLLAMGLKRQQVYIANILKCRPPNNRDPRPEEVQQCEAYLQRQIALIQPQVILAVGRIAAQNLLKTDISVSRLRNQRFEYCGIPVVVTYHPAYLLRSPKEKRKAWKDLQYAMGLMQELSQHKVPQK